MTIVSLNKPLWSALILFVFIFSCNKSKHEEREGLPITQQLVMSDTLRIVLPDSISHIQSTVRPFFASGAKAFRYLTAGKNNELFINSYIYKGNRWEVVKLNMQGPNQVYDQGAFSNINGEFYYFPLNTPHILKLNKKGEILQSFKYSPDRMVAYNSQIKSPNIYDDGQSVYFDIGEYRSLEDESTFEEARLIGVYNYKANELNKIVGYPDEFKRKKWSPNDVAKNSVIVDNRIFMNFSKSKYIYVYDLEGNPIKKSEVGIEAIKNSEGLKSNDSFENALAQVNNGYYHNMIYDEWRNVFYRIAIHYDVKEEIRAPQDMGRAFQKRVMTIITFDIDLNILAEDGFSTVQTYLMENYYVLNSDGFYLNAALPEESENVYTFIKLELKEIR